MEIDDESTHFDDAAVTNGGKLVVFLAWMDLTRRSFVATTLLAFARCASVTEIPTIPQRFLRLGSRPRAVHDPGPATPEPQKLNLGGDRDGVFYVPAKRSGSLLVMLHGATSNGARAIVRLLPFADRLGVIVLAPDSRGTTWDLMTHEVGPDPRFIDRALDRIFSSYAIHPARRIAIAGFSDGATYALTLGLTNGDLFSHVAAFSPGFLVLGDPVAGAPHVTVTHGTKDDILPIDRCGRKVAAALRQRKYDLDYREFDGGHTWPPSQILEDVLRRIAA